MAEKKKRGYYIHFQGRLSVGVSKKIDMQLNEFCRNYDMQEIEVETIERNFFQRMAGLFPTKSIARDYTSALKQIIAPDFVYIRRTVADKLYVQFMRDIKRKYPNCKIIIEIFTYPYDKDNFGKWDAWPFYIKERIYRPKLKRYVDRFVTYSEDKEIFGVPTLRTINGISLETNKLVGGEYHPNLIRLLGVAYMQRQHGFERIILGLADYYKKNGEKPHTAVELWLVGDGPEKEYYQKLADKYKLEKYIKFFENTVGEQLDEIYDNCDLALAAFGMYKVKIDGKISALKTRECLARGIPLLSGSEIDVLDQNFKYALIFPNNSAPVSIDMIVDFYHKITLDKTKKQVACEIRNQTADLIDIGKALEPIINYIEN